MMIEVVLPWPPACLNPNAKRASHWSRYVGPTADYRWDCGMLVREVLGRRRFDKPPIINVHYYPPDRRRRDDDGMVGAFKSGRDGIADAIRHDDSTWRPINHFHEPFPKLGKIVVTLQEQ